MAGFSTMAEGHGEAFWAVLVVMTAVAPCRA